MVLLPDAGSRNVLKALTRPVSCGGARSLRAGVADGQKDGLPAAGGVAPVVRLQDERALGAVSNHEAVHHMMELAAKATALIDVAHQLPRLAAVRRILEQKKGGGGRVLTFVVYHSKPLT